MRSVTMATEQQEQAALFAWVRLMQAAMPELRLLNASLSGVRLTPGQAQKAKALGLVKGFPDIFLPVRRAGYGGLFVELKRRRGGRLTPKQRAWLAALSRQGYAAVCCHGCDAARAVIATYLQGEPDGVV